MYNSTMEYYSVFKREKTLTHTIIEVNNEDTVLSEISWSQKDKHCASTYMRYLEYPKSMDRK